MNQRQYYVKVYDVTTAPGREKSTIFYRQMQKSFNGNVVTAYLIIFDKTESSLGGGAGGGKMGVADLEKLGKIRGF